MLGKSQLRRGSKAGDSSVLAHKDSEQWVLKWSMKRNREGLESSKGEEEGPG